MMAVARKEDGGINWDFYVSLWPMLLAFISVVFWIGGAVQSRMETPEEKTARIQAHTRPLLIRIEVLERQLQDHRGLDGHREMRERMKHVRTDIDELQRDVRDLERR